MTDKENIWNIDWIKEIKDLAKDARFLKEKYNDGTKE